MERHFTVSGFVVDRARTLLHWHRKNGMWLPPGGHIEPGEDPVRAVVREVLEETGVTAEVVPLRAPEAFARPAQIPAPYTILIEDIAEGPHQHIDLIYFLRPVDGVARAPRDGEPFVWVTADQLRRGEALPVASCGVDLPAPEDVRVLALAAIAAAGR
ncbi:MAG: NUDIX domain-containing protein [Chloroflexota bacterium]|nr:NUDIX domain-containing protein [Chloroflexota bacterium]